MRYEHTYYALNSMCYEHTYALNSMYYERPYV
jgi:hypothetical protein